MGRLHDLLKASQGERSLHSAWGRWARAVCSALDGFLWVTMGQVRIGTGSPPIVVEAGPTLGWLFALGNQAYTELVIQESLVDRSKPLVVGVAWAPAVSEVGRTVGWTLDIGLERDGADVATIDLTQVQNVAVPAIAATYERTGFTLAPAEWDGVGTDELHVRLTRSASGGVEPTLPGLHHVVLVQQLRL